LRWKQRSKNFPDCEAQPDHTPGAAPRLLH
jgi:hypothetical protein